MKYDSQSVEIEEREPCIPQLIERVTKLETTINLKFKELDKARELAKEQIVKEVKLAKEVHDSERQSSSHSLEYKLQNMNNFQRRMEKLESEFVTNKTLNDEISKLTLKIDTEINKIILKIDTEIEKVKQKIDTDRKIIHVGIGVVVSFQVIIGIIVLILRHLGV